MQIQTHMPNVLLPNKKTFAEKLAEAMAEKNLTPEDLARKLGRIKVGTVRKWLNGTFGTPSNPELIASLELICGCKLITPMQAKRGSATSLDDLAAA